MRKSNKAITLIALIITIIVLLILAAVTINMVLGENGLFNKTKTAVGKYENVQEKENDSFSKIENLIESNYKLTNTRENLSDLTQGTAEVSDILEGKTAWVNGNKLTGEFKPYDLELIWRAGQSESEYKNRMFNFLSIYRRL